MLVISNRPVAYDILCIIGLFNWKNDEIIFVTSRHIREEMQAQDGNIRRGELTVGGVPVGYVKVCNCNLANCSLLPGS